MFDCIILLYIIYQHQSDPEIPDITWKVSLWFRKFENIISSIPWNLNSVSFVNICHFWDVYFRFRIGDGAWEKHFWWLILVTVSKSNVSRHYGILSANVFTWDSLFIQSFFLSRTFSDPLKIAVLLGHLTQTVSIRNVARFVLRMRNNRRIDDLGTLINGHLSIINYD